MHGTAPAPDAALTIKGLTKRYRSRSGGHVEALKSIDLVVPRGSFFGLLGPNGAGKSTLINILAGLTRKSAGLVLIAGHDLERDTRRARLAIGVVPQELVLDPFFPAREALEVQAGLYGVPKAERRTTELLEAVGLTAQANTYARALSGGMRRRLMVAKALVHRPAVVVLDEPTAGVDVELRQQLWRYMRQLNAAGTTVVLTTHYLEEAEALCDLIAIIHHGRVIACEDTSVLLGRIDRKELAIVAAHDLAAAPPALQRFGAVLTGSRRLTLNYRRSQTGIAEVLDAVREAGIEIADLSTQEGDLEDVFLGLIRGEGEGAGSGPGAAGGSSEPIPTKP
ncbi:MAG: ABC transporter ATP-binding protein [Alphaproteobacteria bacterium]|nr:ABC transporter ATP-binding protein [Alphaproteobacteria bacterium]